MDNEYAQEFPLAQQLADAFLTWPIPESVCADPCATIRGYPHRIGTNLLSAEEACQMFEYVLSIVTTKTARSKCSICNREFNARELSPEQAGGMCIACLVRALNEAIEDSAGQGDQRVNAIQEMDRVHIENVKLSAQLNAYVDVVVSLIKEPYGCPMCDCGKLRNPQKEHWESCPYWKANNLLRAHRKRSHEVSLSGAAAVEAGKSAVYDESKNEYTALQPDAGSDYIHKDKAQSQLDAMAAVVKSAYVHKDQVKPLVEALTRINEISVIDEDMGCAVNWAGDALDHAKSLGL